MPTQGRFQTGKRGTAKRARAMFTNVPFPEAALAKLKKERFFNQRNLEVLTMCDERFLKQILKELAEGKMTMRTFYKRTAGNAWLVNLRHPEQAELANCPSKEFTGKIRELREKRHVRFETLRQIILKRLSKHWGGRSHKQKVLGSEDSAISGIMWLESRFFKFRNALTPDERKALLAEIKNAEEKFYMDLESLLAN
ncbi:MAG: hypothetical protein PHH08_02715 [Candidatus ainarchaeum sp.]|nr:hypothetical protein [Candidatus ainarchaeum sp.]